MKTYARVWLISFLLGLPGFVFGAGQVRTPDIIDGAVTTSKLADGAATGSKLGTDVATFAATTPNFLGNLRVGTGTPAQATTAGSLYVTGPAELGGSVWMNGLTGPALLWVDSSHQVHMVTLDSSLTFVAGTSTLSVSAGAGGSVTSVTASAPLASSGGATPNLTLGTVPIASGGTGQTVAAAAFDALQPMTTAGDLIVGGASGTGTRLAKGSDSMVLTIDPSTHLPAWDAASGGGGKPVPTKVIAASNSLVTTGADYICTGTDDQTTINTAVAALATTGGIIYLEEGLYKLGNGAAGTKNIVINQANIKIVGSGRMNTRIERLYNPTNTTDGPMILVNTGGTDFSLTDVELDGNDATETNANGTGLDYRINVGNNCHIERCWFTAIKSTALKFFTGAQNGVTVRQNYFVGNAAESIMTAGSLTKCMFEENYINGGTYGLLISGGASNTTIEHNQISQATAKAIEIDTSHRNAVVANSLVSTGNQAIYLSTGEANVISSNVVDSASGTAAIEMVSGTADTITGNTINGTITGVGIYVTSGARNSVIGNTISITTTHGIQIEVDSDGVVSGNTIYNPGSGGGAGDGILLSSNTSREIVTGNKITGSAGTGHAIVINSGSVGCLLSNNSFSGTGATDISDSGSQTQYVNQWNGTRQVMSEYGTTITTTTPVMGLVGTMATQTTDKTVANTLTETSLLGTLTGTATLPANALIVGRHVRIHLSGYWSNAVATATINLKLKLGSTVICSTGATTDVGSLTSKEWTLNLDLTCRTTGASGTVMGQGSFNFDPGTLTDDTIGLVSTSATTVDTTASQAIDVTATWGTADASNTITCTNAVIEILN